jgi:hypothetical protein
MATGARKWFGWVEALARPRLLILSGPTAERMVGGVFVLFCASILVPLPATNTTPGIAIALASIGLITRDGCWCWRDWCWARPGSRLLIFGFVFFGTAFLDLLKDFILGLLGAVDAALRRRRRSRISHSAR